MSAPALLEVERKFFLRPSLLRRFRHNALPGAPPFHSLRSCDRVVFRDTYFDTPAHALSAQGIWVRRRTLYDVALGGSGDDERAGGGRSGDAVAADRGAVVGRPRGLRGVCGRWRVRPRPPAWEAKRKHRNGDGARGGSGGDEHTRSVYTEVNTRRSIMELLQPHLLAQPYPAQPSSSYPTSSSSSASSSTPSPDSARAVTTALPDIDRVFNLGVLADFITFREAYTVDGAFTVVLDKTDFSHMVGEVEVLAPDAREAERRIEGFVQRYGVFFGANRGERGQLEGDGGGRGDERPKGKLTAYFERFGKNIGKERVGAPWTAEAL